MKTTAIAPEIPRKITMGRYCRRNAFMESSEGVGALLDQPSG
jgi:hypothetical protein